MREFQAKNKIRNILYSRWMVVVLFILTLFLGRATWSVYVKEQESRANAALAHKELERLVERQNVLNAEIQRLSTDEGIEEEIRSKFSVSKEGEHFFVIVDEDKATTTDDANKKDGWFNSVKEIFR
jgi:cell division protein FtsB